VGFLKYWQLSQIPNFLITIPPISLLYWSSTTYLIPRARLLKLEPLTQIMLPHALHALILTTWIFTGAHVQILLRLAPSMPFFYWSAARLMDEHPKWGRAYVYWTVVWGACSVVLWAAFLPPA
jgi:phosphatidylinositol glycan class V